jgi:hypothetical protein
MEENDIYLNKYRKLSDFACKCCGAVKIMPELVAADKKLLEKLGHVIPINSAWRCLRHNVEIYVNDINRKRILNGWKPYKITWASPHLYGLALDYGHIFGAEDQDMLKECGFTCLRIGRSFSHVDIVPREKFVVQVYD